MLYEQEAQLAPMLLQRALTVKDVAAVIARYNALMEPIWPCKPLSNTVPALTSKVLLNMEPVFTGSLRKKLVYPGLARVDNVYGRVYIGFDVDESGVVRNVTLLSADNIGFNFDLTARSVLEKMPNLKPAYTGHYALPITFALTNAPEKQGLYMPVNTLSADRLDGRVLLDEVVVSTSAGNPVSTVREVWG